MIKIPLLDLHAQFSQIESEILTALKDILDRSSFALGPAVEKFEREFADYCNVKHCVAVNSGTSALHLALLCLNIGSGDEVITVPMTFVATVWAISYVGAKPVFVDIEPRRRTLDPTLLANVITRRTKAILPVHLYGLPADMDAICSIADRHGIPVVEDAAQAHGATYRGVRVGGIGQIGCFSFYPGKNLGAYGEGGALVTNDENIAVRARMLRDHGQAKRYYHEEIGYNYRMDGFQGAVLSIKLRRLDAWNAARAAHARHYGNLLADLPLNLPEQPIDSSSSWHLYVIETKDRAGIQEKLAQRGIQTGLHYPVPVHLQKAYANLALQKGTFPVSESLADQCLSLPMYAELNDQQLIETCEALRNECLGG